MEKVKEILRKLVSKSERLRDIAKDDSEEVLEGAKLESYTFTFEKRRLRIGKYSGSTGGKENYIFEIQLRDSETLRFDSSDRSFYMVNHLFARLFGEVAKKNEEASKALDEILSALAGR